MIKNIHWSSSYDILMTRTHGLVHLKVSRFHPVWDSMTLGVEIYQGPNRIGIRFTWIWSNSIKVNFKETIVLSSKIGSPLVLINKFPKNEKWTFHSFFSNWYLGILDFYGMRDWGLKNNVPQFFLETSLTWKVLFEIHGRSWKIWGEGGKRGILKYWIVKFRFLIFTKRGAGNGP